MIASTSKSPFQGFGPPAWIFSLDGPPLPSTSPLPQPSPAPSSLYADAPAPASRPNLDPDWEDEDASYGPTLKRRGNVRFVRSKLGGGVSAADGGDKGKGREVDTAPKGEMVRGLYESIVGVSNGTGPTTPRPPAPARPRRPPDVDLTLESDSDSDDDIIIIDPTTSLPYPKPPPPPPRIRRRRAPIPAIHELLQPPSATPLVPQVSYGLNPTNIGFQMLLKQGWKQGKGLGVAGEDGGTTALKVPLKASDKFDRKGLGVERTGKAKQGPPKTKREREEERRAKDDEEKNKLGALGLAERAKRDERDRKELLAYLNRP